MIYKCLCVKQPFAIDIVTGDKTIEARSWKTNYRGDLVICSSSKDYAKGWNGVRCPGGVAMAVVELVAVRPFMESDLDAAGYHKPLVYKDNRERELWEETIQYLLQGYAWVIGNVRPFIPIPVKGKLNIFELDLEPEFLPPNSVGDPYWEFLYNVQRALEEVGVNKHFQKYGNPTSKEEQKLQSMIQRYAVLYNDLVVKAQNEGREIPDRSLFYNRAFCYPTEALLMKRYEQ